MPEAHIDTISPRKRWTTPQLRCAEIAELTRGGQGSGADSGTMLGMMMLSDRRLKCDLIPIGAFVANIPLYAFRYIWGGPVRTGMLAQDVIRQRPEAVICDDVGIMHVRYDLLGYETSVIPI